MNFRLNIVLLSISILISTNVVNAVPPTISVSWSTSPSPVLGTDYNVITSSPASADYPNVELLTPSLTWKIWSTDSDNPSSIGDIGVISCPVAGNFGVKILDNSNNAAARDVKGVNLIPTSGSNYSNVTGGHITGDLSGPFKVQKSSGGSGGELSGNFIIDGKVTSTGSVEVPLISSLLDVFGDFEGNIVIGTIDNDTVRVRGSLSGDVDIEEAIADGNLMVFRNVASSSAIVIHDMTGDSTASFAWQDGEGASPEYTFAGDLLLENGIPAGAYVDIEGYTTSTSSINLNGYDLAGQLDTADGGLANISGIDEVSGGLWLGVGFQGITYSGNLTVGSVAAAGYIWSYSGSLYGTIHVNGNMSGAIGIEGNVLGNGCFGNIEIDGDMSGAMYIVDLRNTAEIKVDGLLSGDVYIMNGTVGGSLINVVEGIDSGGSIVVNENRQNSDADGTIYIGLISHTPPTPSVIFDGSIKIKDNVAHTNGGDLTGAITVRGCHATSANLDICICGTNSGTVTIAQSGCSPTVTWSCVSGCP